MKLRTKLIIIFMAIVTIPLVFISVFNYVKTRDALRKEIVSNLRLVAEGKNNTILEYLDGLRHEVVAISEDAFIRHSVSKILAINDAAEKKAAAEELSRYLIADKKERHADIAMIHILDLDGMEIAGMDLNHFWRIKDREQPYFLRGKEKTYIQTFHFHEHHGMRHYFIPVATPVRDKDNNIVGVLMCGYEVDNLAKVLKGERDEGLGSMLPSTHNEMDVDVHMINHNKTFVIPQAEVSVAQYWDIEVDTLPVRACLDKGEAINQEWKDHKGHPVWGASICLKPENDWKWVLIAEQHRSDALMPIVRIRNISIIICLVAISAVFVAALLLSQSISDPIRALQVGTDIIGKGNLDHRVSNDRKDEVGELSRAFDRMVENLKSITASRDELNREVEQRKKAEGELKRFKTILEATPDFVAIVDGKGRTIFVNRGGRKMMGFGEDEDLSDVTIAEYHQKKIADLIMNVGLPEAIDTGLWYGETELLSRNGTRIPVLQVLLSHKSAGGEVEYFSTIARDITDRKISEEQIQLYSTELEQTNEELKHFAYIASHDLQEPLRMISSYVQLLEKRYGNKLDDDAREFIAYAVEGASRMKELINDILTYSRVESRDEEFNSVDFETVLQKALHNLAVIIEENQAEVRHDTLPAVDADASQIVQVFQNLIGNAIKFKSEERPYIHISAEKKENEWLFSVKDNSIGFDQQYADRIFGMYQRLHAKSDYTGSGMGLAISKKIIERLGGRIWVKSDPGKGSTFYFTIPR